MSLYYIFHGESGRAVLDLSLILFIKLELLCRCFTPLSNSKILFHKIAVWSNTAIFKPVLHLTGAQVSFLCSQGHYVPLMTLLWEFFTSITIISFLQNLCQVDLFDQVQSQWHCNFKGQKFIWQIAIVLKFFFQVIQYQLNIPDKVIFRLRRSIIEHTCNKRTDLRVLSNRSSFNIVMQSWNMCTCCPIFISWLKQEGKKIQDPVHITSN